jgi:hypothetical protein
MKACLGKQNPVFGQVSYDKPLIVEVLTPRRQKQPAFWEPSSINGYESVNIIYTQKSITSVRETASLTRPIN